jgi:flagellar FliJ protein
MSKPFTLQPLIDLTQHQNETATRKLGQLNRMEQSAQQKLDMLMEYRKDYQNRLQEASKQGLDQLQLRNFQHFINKLDEAISQQRKAVEQSKVSTQMGRAEFDATQRKLKSFDMLHQRHLDAQKKIAEKSEQKNLDEHTSRLSAYKMRNPENK